MEGRPKGVLSSSVAPQDKEDLRLWLLELQWEDGQAGADSPAGLGALQAMLLRT